MFKEHFGRNLLNGNSFKDFDKNLITIADRSVELIYRREKKKISHQLHLGVIVDRYYNHVRSCRHVDMETLNRPK